MCDLQTTNHQEKMSCDNRVSCTENKCLYNTFTVCSFFNKVFTATGNNNTMYSKNRIGNRKFHS